MLETETSSFEKFQRDGYLVIETGIPTDKLDAITAELTDYWSGNATSADLAYVDFNRIQDAWTISENVRALATWPHIMRVLEQLYGRKPLPFQTLNFPRGTEQRVHADSIHFNSEPFGLMCGVWIALEDIGPDQGPLVYYPGSQKLPELNFEDLGLTANYSEYPKYEDQIALLVEKHQFQAELGVVKKGSAIIWSANVLHGGSKQNDKTLTRHSQVTHYFFEGAKPWRPGYSEESRAYFEPRWIPLTAVHKMPDAPIPQTAAAKWLGRITSAFRAR
jgi:hypothetical protein